MKLTKYLNNPILSANPKNEWENLCVLNPAVIYDQKNEEFVMLYRAAGDTQEHFIYLGLATSKDGFHFERKSDRPWMEPIYNGEDGGGVEDPRLIEYNGTYYITYASRPYAPGRYWLHELKPWFNPPKDSPVFLQWNNTVTYLAYTNDFKSMKRLGRITDTRDDDRDVYLFPERINGKFVRISRPMNACGEGFENENPAIWISYSNDMMEWKGRSLLMKGEYDWESKKIGGSCPPIKTPYGWFMIIHGVSKSDDSYRVGAVLMDLENPSKIIARTKNPLMEPDLDYEKTGFYNGCVFPTGNVVKDNTLYVYYGAADKFVCVATANFEELLQDMMKNDLIK